MKVTRVRLVRYDESRTKAEATLEGWRARAGGGGGVA